MIKNPSDKIYVGVSKNPKQRLYSHNTKQGAQFTDAGNFLLVFQEEYKTLAEARKWEIQSKKWRREEKDMLIKRFAEGLQMKLTQ